ncbi:TPA: P-loop NTPase fold protein [Klebsiella quasipneumoniae]|uniref:KAP family P-loop NTPase fold protein n=1 Tax=Klebsiella TaxID=570 RepID=UPI0029DE22D3|nr:P-loop NTPase fold protein [Klebsiella quasipneumoniae]MDX6813512.1 P-loop NTPase fold protein [Klebsiella quasipneumoniae]
MFNFLKKKKAIKTISLDNDCTSTSSEVIATNDQFTSDQPITGKSQDRFNRAPFATRIAETIATRGEHSSIVIGIFGPWGDGKTSVLEMMQETLQSHANVVTIRFNPWHFQSEELLLRGFFTTLADGMGQSLPNMKEKAGELLKKYGNLLSLASITVGGVIQITPGETAKGFGDAMSNVGLDELKARIEGMLDEANKRLVIMIDDIDRLDRTETHAIFKLVKLSASFKHTSYVLAFDDAVVSASLGERYGDGGSAAGRAFLEKIIQVPLHLPPADQNSLRALALESIQNTLNQTEIQLTQPQVDTFIRHFDDAVLPNLETPRRAKLYSNALMFALPILKGEANPVDLMLIEGIRVIFPSLYITIRENPELFLNGERDRSQRRLQDRGGEIDSLIEQATPLLTDSEREVLKSRLLVPLFPRIGNMGYGHEWEETWGKEQKICSSQYFKRYFTYSIPIGDVPDAQIKSLCEDLPSATDLEKRAMLETLALRQALPRAISRLRQLVDSLTPTQAISLITALTMNGDFLPRERGMMILADTQAKAAMLISELLRQIPDKQSRQIEAERAIQLATPISFAMECIRWISHYDGKSEEKRVLSDDGELSLKVILTARIEDADNLSPIFVSYSKDASSLYWCWIDGTSETHVQKKIISHFDKDPELLDVFLACYVGEAWGMESGLPRPADFRRDQYNAVCSIVPAEYIASNLKLRYGEELEHPESYPSENMLQARRVAHQFMNVHQYVLAEKKNAKLPSDDAPSDEINTKE